MYYRLNNACGIYYLNIYDLNSIPNPKNVILLNITKKRLNVLPDLSRFINLKYLYCGNNNLKNIQNLPSNLKSLYCEHNDLIELSNLPETLELLNCDYNKLKQLPELPLNLRLLSCNNNNLIELPNLSLLYKLEVLCCDYNKITVLTDNININHLSCNNNNLSVLPKISYNFKFLYCSNNFNLKLPRSIIFNSKLKYYKKYKTYKNINELTYLLNYNIENYYYSIILKYYTRKLKIKN